MPVKRTNVTIDEIVHRRAKVAAAERGVMVKALVEAAIDHYLTANAVALVKNKANAVRPQHKPMIWDGTESAE